MERAFLLTGVDEIGYIVHPEKS